MLENIPCRCIPWVVRDYRRRACYTTRIIDIWMYSKFSNDLLLTVVSAAADAERCSCAQMLNLKIQRDCQLYKTRRRQNNVQCVTVECSVNFVAIHRYTAHDTLASNLTNLSTAPMFETATDTRTTRSVLILKFLSAVLHNSKTVIAAPG